MVFVECIAITQLVSVDVDAPTQKSQRSTVSVECINTALKRQMEAYANAQGMMYYEE